MSATGQGPRLGGDDDVYPTPHWCVDRLLDEVQLPGGLWIEPGAGDGAIIRAVNARRSDVSWLAIESRATMHEPLLATGADVIIDDYLAYGRYPTRAAEATVVFGNPPYSCAFDFITRSMEIAPTALVVLLLRVNFLASQERNAFMRESAPDLNVLPDRPSFRTTVKKVVIDGKVRTRKTNSDSCEYGWFVWHPDVDAGRPRVGALRVLATTPKAVRIAARKAAGR